MRALGPDQKWIERKQFTEDALDKDIENMGFTLEKETKSGDQGDYTRQQIQTVLQEALQEMDKWIGSKWKEAVTEKDMEEIQTQERNMATLKRYDVTLLKNILR